MSPTPATTSGTTTPDQLLARIDQLERTLTERVAALEAALVAKDQVIQSLQLEVDRARVTGEITAQIVTAQQLSATAIREGTQRLEDKYIVKASTQGNEAPINQTLKGALNVQGGISGTLAELKTKEHTFAEIRAHDLFFGNLARGTKLNKGAQGRALVDLGNALVVNFGPDWERVILASSTQVHNDLVVGGKLTTHGGLWSPNLRCMLNVQDDGNLVLYSATQGPIWASNTAGRA